MQNFEEQYAIQISKRLMRLFIHLHFMRLLRPLEKV